MNIPIEQAGKGLKGQDWFLRERQKGERLGPHIFLKGPGEAAEGRAVGTAISHEGESQKAFCSSARELALSTLSDGVEGNDSRDLKLACWSEALANGERRCFQNLLKGVMV